MKEKLSGLTSASAKLQRRTGHVHTGDFGCVATCTELFLDDLSSGGQHLVGHLQLLKAL